VTIRPKRFSSVRNFRRVALIAYFLVLLPAILCAQEDFDQYKIRVSGFWFYSDPSGSLQGSNDSGSVDLNKDLGFNNYSTFAGKADWKFTRKNHLYVSFLPFYTSRQTVLDRTFTFQGQTFDAGLVANSDLHNFLVAPGYQYDIIRRRRGHFGLGVQMDLFSTSAKINATGEVNGIPKSVSASGSLLAPIPVAGPEFRLYLTNSPRVFVEGNVYGMYLFGYGNFVSSVGTLGVTLTKHVSLNGGYQLGSRLVITNSNSDDRLGVRLTQKGAIAGMEFSF
jgi:hypothetical protein